MTSPKGLLVRLAGALSASGMPWMITGSTASAFYGEPRATQDVDVVVDPTPDQVLRFLDELRDGFYVSRDEAGDALRIRGMFNVIDLESGWKAGIIVCPDRPFERNEIARRRPARLFGVDVFVISPEGSVVSKLRWAASSGSERQLRDAASVLAGCQGDIDLDYIRREAEVAGVSHLLAKILPPG
ncbi:MAG TPA: hypothetical protein P5164_09055 [Thermoanaerobaculia bacterium]|nr:hypothetical protein [Thermoanaerobaculia bacterium]